MRRTSFCVSLKTDCGDDDGGRHHDRQWAGDQVEQVRRRSCRAAEAAPASTRGAQSRSVGKGKVSASGTTAAMEAPSGHPLMTQEMPKARERGGRGWRGRDSEVRCSNAVPVRVSE